MSLKLIYIQRRHVKPRNGIILKAKFVPRSHWWTVYFNIWSGSILFFKECRYIDIQWWFIACPLLTSVVAQMVKNMPVVWVTQVWEDTWRRQWQSTPVFLPGEFHGQRSLVGYIVHGVTKSWTCATDTFLTSVEDREKQTSKIELCSFTVRKNMKAALSDLPLKAVALLPL